MAASLNEYVENATVVKDCYVTFGSNIVDFVQTELTPDALKEHAANLVETHRRGVQLLTSAPSDASAGDDLRTTAPEKSERKPLVSKEGKASTKKAPPEDVEITVPDGYEAGQVLTTKVHGKKLKIKLPEGAVGGQKLKVHFGPSPAGTKSVPEGAEPGGETGSPEPQPAAQEAAAGDVPESSK